MFKVQIKNKANEVTHEGQFKTQGEVDAWVLECEAVSAWGQKERWIQDTPMKPLTEEEKAKAKANRKVKGPLGEDITEYQFEAEYVIDVKDITVEVEAEKTKKDKKDKDRKDRVKSLKNIDWAKIKNFNDALPILQALVNEQLKDDV